MSTPHETNETLLALPSGRYDDALWALLFEIWLFLADRSPKKTREVFLSQFRDSPTFNEERVPTIRAIQYRIQKDGWHERANQIIREQAPLMDESFISRMYLIADEALTVAQDIIQGKYLEHPRTGNVAVLADMVKEFLKIKGLGTHGMLAGQPTFEVKIANVMEQAPHELSTDEKAAWLRDRILSRKQHRKLTGHEKKD